MYIWRERERESVCVCVCVYICEYVYVYIHTSTRVHKYTYVCMRIAFDGVKRRRFDKRRDQNFILNVKWRRILFPTLTIVVYNFASDV